MPPFIYLVRHAHASDSADDAARKLSDRGHKQMKKLARLLEPSGAFQPAEIWHSPLVRARETAELLKNLLRLDGPLVEHRDLEPGADPAVIARKLGRATKPVAVVGHEPHLSALASLLVGGATEPVLFTVRKATVIALESTGDGWSVRWQVSPDLFD